MRQTAGATVGHQHGLSKNGGVSWKDVISCLAAKPVGGPRSAGRRLQ